ncbi:MAG: hypothetical protein ACKVP0_13660 [Pirellulaceae bacterium]
MPNFLDSFIGRVAVFVETSQACLASVGKVESDSERICVGFQVVPDSFGCRLRFFRQPGDDPIEELLTEPPFGDAWDVMVSNKEFYLDDDHWQASFLFGGGFRAFFQPAFVQRFILGDVTWLDEFYGDDED